MAGPLEGVRVAEVTVFQPDAPAPAQLRTVSTGVSMSGNLRDFPRESIAPRRLFFTGFLFS